MSSNASRQVSRFYPTAKDIINQCGKNSQINHLHILVNGVTFGIGIVTSRALTYAGAKIYLLERDETKLQNVAEKIKEEITRATTTI